MMRFLAAGLPVLASTNRVTVDPKTGHFVDTQGNALIFHGVNAIQKSFPWHPSTGDFDPSSSLNAEDMQNLKDWGFNAVRLGVMWHGVEPEQGQYNSTYLQVVRRMVDDMYDQGIYTIVDFHQDVIAEKWCGEGIPSWVAEKLQNVHSDCSGFIPKIAEIIGQCHSFDNYHIDTDKTTGFPDTQGCLSNDFTTYSQCPEVFTAWGAFYQQQDIQEHFQSYWRKVASTFAGSPGVLGYDLINEPNPGNFVDDPSLLLPTNADRKNLQPLYKALTKIIQSEDPDALIMYEPAPFPGTMPSNIPVLGGVHPVGFTEGPADPTHQALSYHIYSCGFADTECTREGDTKSLHCPTCDAFASDWVKQRQEDSQNLGGGVFMTEFGACADSQSCLVEIERVTSRADTAFHSWAYWQFKYYNDVTTVSGPIEGFYTADGALQQKKVAALSRTYAPKIGGVPQQMQYDMSTGAFRLQYLSNGGSTEIYMNEHMNYPAGYSVHAFNAATKKMGTNRIEVQADAGVTADVAIVPPYQGESSGFFYSADKDTLRWSIEASETPGFELTVANNMTSGYWHGFKIRDDDGKELCSFGMQDDNHGPEGCNLEGASQHGLLFSYKIEIWKAKILGIHTYVDAIGVDTFGPLYGKRLSFNWVDDNPPFISV